MGDWILVTGGAGYVGAHIARKLLQRGERVRIFDQLLYGADGLKDLIGQPGLELIVGDITDRDALRRAAVGTRAVIALAALVGDAACDLDPERAVAVNYHGTAHTLEACRSAGARRLVFASSCSVYGANGMAPLSEESHVNPVSLYARTRLMSEELLREQAADLDVVVLRLATICGVSPRMRFDLMVNTMTACAAVDGAIRVSGADQWRPHIHVRDAAAAFIRAVDAPLSGFHVFNAGSDEQNFTIGEVAEHVAARMPGVRLERVASHGDRRSYRVSFERIRRALGFDARFGVDDAIDEVGALFQGGAALDFTHDRFHNAKWLRVNERRCGAA
jgi:nucleoside-diphosphate-sugar epimerase